MNIAIIGAGFSGLSAGYTLSKKGHSVTIFEKDSFPGGLAVGYKEKEWKWTLEKHYHHLFTNDSSALNLAREINHSMIIKRPTTSSYVNGEIYQLDSPKTLLTFPKLSIVDRFRMAASLGVLRFNPFWKPFEKFTATSYLKKTMGGKGYKTIWEPLMVNKLGSFADEVSLAWFWARIKKRTSSLAYPEGGFLEFANALVETIKKHGGVILYDTEILELLSKDKVQIKTNSREKKTYQFDAVIVTTPSFLFTKFSPQLPESYKKKLLKLKGIGAINMVLRFKKDFLENNTYWLNVCSQNAPILAIVEHTHFMDRKYYNNESIVYAGNYLPHDHSFFKKSSSELLKEYHELLFKINPHYKKNLIDYKVFHAPFAQPIIPKNYSKQVPTMKTPLQNVYLANIQQVYPWDRGTNYAIELGEKVANLVINT